MIYFDEIVTHTPKKVGRKEFHFSVSVATGKNMALRVTFSLPSAQHSYVVNDNKQKRFSVTVDSRDNPHSIPAQVSGPAGLLKTKVTVTDTANANDTMSLDAVITM